MCGQKQVCCVYHNLYQVVVIIPLPEIKGKLYCFFPDYYNYYYGGYTQNPEASNTQEDLNTATAVAAVEAAEGSEATEVTSSHEAAGAEVSSQPENNAAASTEVCRITNVAKTSLNSDFCCLFIMDT